MNRHRRPSADRVSVRSTVKGNDGRTRLVPQSSVFANSRGKMGKSTARMAMMVMHIIWARHVVRKGGYLGGVPPRSGCRGRRIRARSAVPAIPAFKAYG